MAKKKSVRNAYVCAALAGILACSGPGSMTAWAEEELYQAVDGNQIAEERLRDQTVEYEELGNLIHANNVTVQNAASGVENSRKTYTEDLEYLRSEKASARWNKDEAKDEGDMVSYAEYASYEAVYKSSIKSYNKMLDRLDQNSTNKSRVMLEKQLTNAAQSLMMSYQSMTLQKEYLATMEELLRTQYDNAQTRQQAGLSTDQEVMTARSSWESARASLKSMESGEAAIYQNLCILLGVGEEGEVTIQKIPSVDVQKMDEMNLEEDTKKAITNNYDIISERSQSSGRSTAGVNKKTRTVEEMEEKLTVKMNQLYEDVQQAKTAYDAAEAGNYAADITWNSAQKKHEMGMLSNDGYLQEQIQYLQKKNNFESAELNLFQALETYWWAVNGIADF